MKGKSADDVARAVEAVVGERYRPPRRIGALLLKGLAGAVAAVLAMAAIAWILHRHVADAQKAPAPKKPVPVRIVPAR